MDALPDNTAIRRESNTVPFLLKTHALLPIAPWPLLTKDTNMLPLFFSYVIAAKQGIALMYSKCTENTSTSIY